MILNFGGDCLKREKANNFINNTVISENIYPKKTSQNNKRSETIKREKEVLLLPFIGNYRNQ